jgi:hypothetical protein
MFAHEQWDSSGRKTFAIFVFAPQVTTGGQGFWCESRPGKFPVTVVGLRATWFGNMNNQPDAFAPAAKKIQRQPGPDQSLPMWHRLKPALSLFLLAPLIAEYLLGSLSFNQLVLFPLMALMYGAGALFVREVTRRSGRGWPTIITLGLAYGVIEEGLATQSLFNPHYLGLRLLDYGFIPALGVGGPWMVYVVLLHVVWSIAVPIGLVEALFSDRRTAPWLKKTGFIISGVIYVLGVALVALGTKQREKFTASGTQLAATAVIAAILIVAAFVLFRRRQVESAGSPASPRWRPLTLGVLAFVTGSVFHLVTQLGSNYLSPVAAILIALALPLGVIAIVRVAQKSGAWTDAHTDAMMLGGLLAYCWLGFFLVARLHGANAIPGQCFPFAIVMFLIYWRFVRPQPKVAN